MEDLQAFVKPEEVNHERVEELIPSTMASEQCCRICLDIGSEPLISPCLCSGTAKFTHEQCLKTWIIMKFADVSVAQCEVCRTVYSMEIINTWKCNAKQGINDKFTYCCSIPILISILIAMGIILFIVAVYHLNFESSREYSILILIICILPTIGSIILLIRSLYKALIVYDVKDWKIKSYVRQAVEVSHGREPIEGSTSS